MMRARLTAGWWLVGGAVLAIGVMPAMGMERAKKPKKPKLTLRILPKIAMAPVDVVVVARLEGGDELVELYCPEVEVEWGDGSTSTQDPECAPFEPGITKIERRYSVSHTFRTGGRYDIRFRLNQEDRTILDEYVELRVGPGFGEMD